MFCRNVLQNFIYMKVLQECSSIIWQVCSIFKDQENINQLTNHLIWFAFVIIFSTELKKQIYMNKVEDTTFAGIDFYFCSFIFKKSRFHWKKPPFRKQSFSWRRTKWYWYRCRWMRNDEEWGIDEKRENLIVAKSVLEIWRNKGDIRRFTVVYRCPLSDKCCRWEYFFSKHVWHLMWIN